MTSESELCEAHVARDQVSGAVVNVAPQQTQKRSHHAKPRSEGSAQMVGRIADARCEEDAVLSRLVDRALPTQHHALFLWLEDDCVFPLCLLFLKEFARFTPPPPAPMWG